MCAKKIILSRQLPKTGQSIVYRAGDDGTYQAGWWKGRLLSANKVRFIEKTIDGDAVVIDRATGLMWPKDAFDEGGDYGGSSVWSAAVDYCQNLDFAGFTDWRLPNITELSSLLNYAQFYPAINDLFINFANVEHWSSTRYSPAAGYFWTLTFYNGDKYHRDEDETHYFFAVRSGL